MKIFRLLPLSIHNLSFYKFCFERHRRLNSYRARYKVVQGTNCTRFNFYNKVWKYTNNNDDIEIRVKQKKNKKQCDYNDNNSNNITNANNNDIDNKINGNSDNIETTALGTI